MLRPGKMVIMIWRVMIRCTDLDNENNEQIQGIDCQGGDLQGVVQGIGHG